ncbi:MAG: YfiR family protein [Acidobacteria bacterium]|jgi:hypothetical protein|nr:YfiR family protein [Acidobacteriota bacterium]
MSIMKNVKITILLYSVFVIFFSAARYAFPLPYAGKEGELEGKTSPRPDYEVKALVISKFVNYCERPTNSAVSNPEIPFIIGALEESDVTLFLIEVAKNKKIGGKQAKILIISDDNEIKNCNLLYISGISEKRLIKILEIIGSLPILTVADMPNFEEKGVMINIFSVGKKYQFNVNLSAARKSGLQLKSTLLKLALEIIE